MNTSELQVNVRPMALTDLTAIIDIDQKIRTAETPTTYKDFTIRKIFGIGLKEVDPEERPNILEVAKLIDLGFVAETEGSVCGFVVGRQTYLAEHGIQEGEIAIIGVHPDHRGKGIATKLLNSLGDLFRSRGIQRVRMGVDPLDNDMLAFLERTGFSGQRLLYFTKSF